MAMKFHGFEAVNSETNNISNQSLDQNVTQLTGSPVIVSTTAKTGARSLEVPSNAGGVAVAVTTPRPFVPIYIGFSVSRITATAPSAAANIFSVRYNGSIVREITYDTSSKLHWADGSNNGMYESNTPTWLDRAAATGWKDWSFVIELFPWGPRPYERIWYWRSGHNASSVDDTSWQLWVDIVRPLSGSGADDDLTATPQRNVLETAWCGTDKTTDFVLGAFGKIAGNLTCRFDDAWFLVPSAAPTAYEYEQVRPGLLAVASMVPTGDVTTQWDRGTTPTTHYTQVDDLPVADTVAVATDPRDQVDTASASKTDEYSMGAMPAGTRPMGLKVCVGGGGPGDPVHMTYGLIDSTNSLSDMKTPAGDVNSIGGRGVPNKAAGDMVRYYEHPPSAAQGAWTEAVINACHVRMATDGSNSGSYALAGALMEVLHEIQAPASIRTEVPISVY